MAAQANVRKPKFGESSIQIMGDDLGYTIDKEEIEEEEIGWGEWASLAIAWLYYLQMRETTTTSLLFWAHPFVVFVSSC